MQLVRIIINTSSTRIGDDLFPQQIKGLNMKSVLTFAAVLVQDELDNSWLGLLGPPTSFPISCLLL